MAHAAAKLPELQNCASSFQTWCCNEILRRLLTDVANELRDKGALDEEECFTDATFVMAKGGGSEVGTTKRGKSRLGGLVATLMTPQWVTLRPRFLFCERDSLLKLAE
jgi:hypothetical protein